MEANCFVCKETVEKADRGTKWAKVNTPQGVKPVCLHHRGVAAMVDLGMEKKCAKLAAMGRNENNG